MKKTLIISGFLNIILLGVMAFVWWRSQRMVVISTMPVAPRIGSPSLSPVQPTPIVVHEPASPFQWSQLVSTNDYRDFVANLRKAGCPESTVDAIVQGDVQQVFSMMRERLGVAAAEPGRWSRESQAEMTAYLLGQATTGSMLAGGQSNLSPDHQQTPGSLLESFLENADLTSPGMSIEQAQQITDLRQSFLAQIDGANRSGQLSVSQAEPQPQTDASGDPAPQPSADTTQTETDSGLSRRAQMSQAMILATEQQSILAGMFGSGTAAQYDQYQAAQVSQQ